MGATNHPTASRLAGYDVQHRRFCAKQKRMRFYLRARCMQRLKLVSDARTVEGDPRPGFWHTYRPCTGHQAYSFNA